MRRKLLSPAYNTCWPELMVAKACWNWSVTA
ncbi:hypothetical protein [Pseudomonas sp.]|nr:hypothetical protein [Pseudomonas sp.]